jgi:anti-sigma factor RsiW
MEDEHFSDEDLLTALDGEQPPPRLAEIRRHIVSCWSCRARSSGIERTIREFVKTYHRSSEAIPEASASRAILKARLSKLTSNSEARGRRLADYCQEVFAALRAKR